jgi:hypothetical protein
MKGNDARHYPGTMRSNLQVIPGAKENAVALVVALSLFLLLVVLASVLLFQALRLGAYGRLQVNCRFPVIAVVWLVISFVLALVAVHLSLMLSERVAGPIRRMERILDCALKSKNMVIVLREKDALNGIAERINKLLAMRKNIPS